MTKKIFCVCLWLCLFYALAYPQTDRVQIDNLPLFKKQDRILILVPHPDDETIACAGIIQQAIDSGANIRVVYLTNGEHNQFAFIVYEKRIPLRKSEFIHLGEVRRKEAIEAMKLLGLGENNLIFLGYPDSGTFAIFAKHWQEVSPFKTMLTRVSSVPYRENRSFGAPYKGESILADLESIIGEYQPNKIFVSHPADANLDHKALYLFLQVALADLNKDIPRPEIYPYLVHWVGWPLPRRYHPELPLIPPEQFADTSIHWFKQELAGAQIDNKYQAILSYKSQTESSAFYLLSFARRNELFSDYPDVEPKQKEFLGESAMYTGSDAEGGASSLGQGRVTYSVEEDALLIRIDKMQIRGSKMSFGFYLFGYSYKKPFPSMSKIRIILKGRKIRVWDANKLVEPQGLRVESGDDWLVLAVPVRVLGDPDFVLACAKTYAALFSVNTSAFRKISLKK